MLDSRSTYDDASPEVALFDDEPQAVSARDPAFERLLAKLVAPDASTPAQIRSVLRAAYEAGAAKATAKPAPVPLPRTEKKASTLARGELKAIIAGLLTRPQGCMMWEVDEATDYVSVSLPRYAKMAGLKLIKVRIVSNTHRFFGVPLDVAEAMDIEVVGPPKAMRLVMTPKVRRVQAASGMSAGMAA